MSQSAQRLGSVVLLAMSLFFQLNQGDQEHDRGASGIG